MLGLSRIQNTGRNVPGTGVDVTNLGGDGDGSTSGNDPSYSLIMCEVITALCLSLDVGALPSEAHFNIIRLAWSRNRLEPVGHGQHLLRGFFKCADGSRSPGCEVAGHLHWS